MAMEEMGSRIVGDYKIGPNKIGSGSFSDVWMGHHHRDGVEVAVKEIDKRKLSSKVKGILLKEITILRQVFHPNIVKLHQAIQTEDKIYLILEYCTGGDFAAYIHRHGRVSESVARHFMRQIASGLQVLRENNLIHRDLKPQNLLLCTKDDTPVLKIGDFGFARELAGKRRKRKGALSDLRIPNDCTVDSFNDNLLQTIPSMPIYIYIYIYVFFLLTVCCLRRNYKALKL